MITSRKAIWFFIIAAIIAIGALTLTLGMVSAADIFVGPGEAYTTIQSAEDAANPFDIIIVRDGIYTENIDVTVDNVTIRSENGSANCIVNASNQNDHVFRVTANWVNISGFTVQNATGFPKAGIYLTHVDHCTISENTVSNNYHGISLAYSSSNTLTDNTASNIDYSCIWLYYSSNNTLTGNSASNTSFYGIYLHFSGNNTLTGNTVSNSNWGIELHDSSYNTLTENTASNNNRGIYLYYSSNNTLIDNTAANNTHGIGLYSYSSNNTLTGNTVLNNTSGIYLENSSYNTLTANTALNTTYEGIDLYSSSNNTLTGNNAANNYHGIYLDDSSNNNTLSGNTANSNDWYGIRLRSSSTNTLMGNTANSNDRHGIYLSYSSNNNTLTGNTASSNNYSGISLTFSSNNNTLTGNAAQSNNLHGILLESSSSNSLTDNTAQSNIGDGIELVESLSNNLMGNIASNNFNGISVLGSSNNNLISNTATSNNYSGIYLAYSSNNNTLTNNTVSNNNQRGIYLLSSSNNNTFTNNTVLNNSDYGIHISSSSYNNTLTNNTVSNNEYGIRLYSSNNTLTGNTASNNDYDGIRLDGSSNNTLTGNTASNNSYCGIYLFSSDYNMLTGNTAHSNIGSGIRLASSSYNTLTGNTANSNNQYGIRLGGSSNNHIHNNYFNNTNNAYDDGNNIWNITKKAGINIINGSYLGGNYWSDYTGEDTDGDGLGNTRIPHNSSGAIVNGGDYLPLVLGNFITNIELTPPSPATLEFNENVDVTFDYSTNETGGVRIFLLPFTSGSPTLHYAVSKSLLYPVGTGSGSAFFTIMKGEDTVEVDQIRFQMWNADQSTLLLEFFIPVEYYFGMSNTFSIDLAPGFNLISIPLELTDTSLDAVVGSGAVAMDEIYEFDNVAGYSSSMYTGAAWAGAVTAIQPEKGYWYNRKGAPCTLNVTGSLPAGPITTPIYTGWNLVGYQSTQSQGLGIVNAPVAMDEIYEFDNVAGYSSSMYTGATWAGSVTGFEPGKGYWYNRKGSPFDWVYTP